MDPVTLSMLALTAGQMVQGIGKEKRDRQLAAATQRYSPWTGLKAQPVEDANTFGTAAQGGAAALGYEQQKNLSASNDQLRAAQINALNRVGNNQNPYGRVRGYNGPGSQYDFTQGSVNAPSPMGEIPYNNSNYAQALLMGGK